VWCSREGKGKSVGWNRLVAALSLVLPIAMAVAVEAGPRPVVVELYTSQGCSSCPPADELLRELSQRDDVIPLALHVDYWDYIGWKDEFARPAHSRRQRAYARAAGQTVVYTPQMVIAGEDHLVGAKPMKLVEFIQKHSARRPEVSMSVRRQGQVVRIEARANGEFREPVVIHLVRYLPEKVVSIARGENAGRTITYSNIVTEVVRLGTWNGSGPLAVERIVSGEESTVVLLQRPGHGPIVAAQRLR